MYYSEVIPYYILIKTFSNLLKHSNDKCNIKMFKRVKRLQIFREKNSN